MATQDLGNPELHLVLDRKRGLLAGRGDKRQERATWRIVSVELPDKESTHTAWFLLDSEGIVREPGLYPLTEAWLTPNQKLNSYDFEGRDRKTLARVLEGVRGLGT